MIALPVPIFVNNFTALYEAHAAEIAKEQEDAVRKKEEKMQAQVRRREGAGERE